MKAIKKELCDCKIGCNSYNKFKHEQKCEYKNGMNSDEHTIDVLVFFLSVIKNFQEYND